MKKLLCYLGILVLLFLVFLPPVLRMVLPEKGEKQEEEVKEHVVLTCTNEDFITNTSYENNKIQMIVLKKFKTDLPTADDNESEDSNLEDNVTEEETELGLLFNDLKTKGNITYNELEDGDVIGIDFSLTDHDKLNIVNLTKSIEEQKEYYESQNLSCVIKK